MHQKPEILHMTALLKLIYRFNMLSINVPDVFL